MERFPTGTGQHEPAPGGSAPSRRSGPWMLEDDRDSPRPSAGAARSGRPSVARPVVPMTEAERKLAVQSLAVILHSWLDGRRAHSSPAVEGLDQPKTHLGGATGPGV